MHAIPDEELTRARGGPRLASRVPTVTGDRLRSIQNFVLAGTQSVGYRIARGTDAVGFRMQRSPLLALAVAGAFGVLVGFVSRRLITARRTWR